MLFYNKQLPREMGGKEIEQLLRDEDFIIFLKLLAKDSYLSYTTYSSYLKRFAVTRATLSVVIVYE